MADALEKLCSIAKALRLCRQCETRLTGIGSQQADDPPLLDLPIEDLEKPVEDLPKRGRSRTPRQRSTASSKSQASSAREIIEQPSNEVSYRRCFINNVRSVDCDFQSFSVKDCDLENVTFRGCSFSNVVFEDLKLKNVTFFNVDFRSVWLKNINWICALWDGVGLANAVVTGYDFLRQLEDEKRPKLILSLKARPTSKLSKTMILHPQRAQSSRAVQDGESEIVCQESVQNLLRLPDKVVDRILDRLFPRVHREQIVMVSPIQCLHSAFALTSSRVIFRLQPSRIRILKHRTSHVVHLDSAQLHSPITAGRHRTPRKLQANRQTTRAFTSVCLSSASRNSATSSAYGISTTGVFTSMTSPSGASRSYRIINRPNTNIWPSLCGIPPRQTPLLGVDFSTCFLRTKMLSTSSPWRSRASSGTAAYGVASVGRRL